MLLLTPNLTCLLYVLWLGTKIGPELLAVYRGTQTLRPWKKEMANPGSVLAKTPDALITQVILELDQANEINTEIVEAQKAMLVRALRNLSIIAVVLTLEIGYNAAWIAIKTAQSVQKAGAICPKYIRQGQPINPQILPAPPQIRRKSQFGLGTAKLLKLTPNVSASIHGATNAPPSGNSLKK